MVAAIITHGGYLSPIDAMWPSITANANNKSVIYWTPYWANLAPMHDGTGFVMMAPGQMQLALNAAHLAATLYNVFLISVGGTPTLAASVAWDNSTPGACVAGQAEVVWDGTTAWQPVNRYAQTMTNGANSYSVPAGRGRFLGTFYPSGDGFINCQVEPGQYRRFDLWNRDNQQPLEAVATDPAAGWILGDHTSVAASAAALKYRHSNANQWNCVRVPCGMAQRVSAEFSQVYFTGYSTETIIAIQRNAQVDGGGFPVASGFVPTIGRNVAGAPAASDCVNDAFGVVHFNAIERIESLDPSVPEALRTGESEFWGRADSMQLRVSWMG